MTSLRLKHVKLSFLVFVDSRGKTLNPSAGLVNRLWRMCAVLRKDGVTYQQYVTELTYLLFLKMIQETGLSEASLPAGYGWREIVDAPIGKKLKLYRATLDKLGNLNSNVARSIIDIFTKAETVIRDEKNLVSILEQLDSIKWFSKDRDSFGDIYEGLLEKNAEETKRGAGQYFTPRVVIDVIVALMKPSVGEVVQDPAAGTGGFLVAAQQHARAFSGGDCVVTGIENVRDTYRLLRMNLYLHNSNSDSVFLGDTLSDDHLKLSKSDLILTNPPFGPSGGRPSRKDLIVTSTVSSFALPFVEHCINALLPGGRAAIVVPDSILYEDGRGRALRKLLLDTCNLHTILRLPSGIFYAQGVKTNVLFFQRGYDSENNTKSVWVYDLRTDMPAFGKTVPLSKHHFDSFAEFYGDNANGKDRSDNERAKNDLRARNFTREEISNREDNLDITWLREDDSRDEDSIINPEDILAAIVGHLSTALTEITALAEDLDLSTDLTRQRSSIRTEKI